MSTRTRKTQVTTAPEPSLRFSPINGVLFALGMAAIVGGYVLLADGSTVGAPLLLVLGYAVLVPLAIAL